MNQVESVSTEKTYQSYVCKKYLVTLNECKERINTYILH